MNATRHRLLRRLFSPGGFLVLGVLARLVHILSMGNRAYFGDTAEYEAAAIRLLHGQGFDQTSPRAPLYPIFMALSFWIGGEGNLVAVRLFKLVLAAALMFVTARLARWLGGRGAETLAALGMAFAPTLVFVSGLLYPTTLYTLLLATMALAAWRLSERPTMRLGAIFGAAFVLAWLTDQIVIAPGLAILLWLALHLRSRGAPLVRALAFALAIVAAVAVPYTAFLRTLGGERVYMKKAQSVLHSARTDSVLSQERLIRFPAHTPFQPLFPGDFARRELGLLKGNPAGYTHDVLSEFLHFFQPLPDRIQTRNRYSTPIVLLVGAIYFTVLLPLAMLGLFAGAGPRRGRWLLAIVVLSTAMFYSFFFTQARYRIPVEPQLIILAALGVQRLFPRVTAFISGDGPGAPAT